MNSFQLDNTDLLKLQRESGKLNISSGTIKTIIKMGVMNFKLWLGQVMPIPLKSFLNFLNGGEGKNNHEKRLSGNGRDKKRLKRGG